MFFVGDITASVTDGSELRGPHCRVGKMELDGTVYNLQMTPTIAFSNLNGAMCIPAWTIPVVRGSDQATLTFMRQAETFIVPAKRAELQSDLEVTLDIWYMVGKAMDDDDISIKMLNLDRFPWECKEVLVLVINKY